ncbi:hypothetical protein G6549_03705 [Bacillus sp. MM2020_1]|nr:hypothetical protein [Bacillus sp. MM2020_1]
MKKSEWSDKQLEELLRQMPKIQDNRNPRDIYQNLNNRKKKIKQWLLPGLATACALLIFFILVPKLMIGNQFAEEKASQKDASAGQEVQNADENSKLAKESDNSQAKTFSEAGNNELLKTAIYDDDVNNGTVLTYWIPNSQAQILVPVSTLVNDSNDKLSFTLFIEKMMDLQEEAWGLSEFYPLNATLKLDEKSESVLIDVPANHQYGQDSTAETNFIKVLQKDIASNSQMKKIHFSTNGEPGIELGNYGRQEEIQVVEEKNHAFFFYYSEGNEIPYLVPSIDTYKDIHTALEAMKNDQPLLGLKSSLLPALPIKDVSTNEKTLYVTLKENSTLSDNQLTLNAYESLLLTAKEFGLEKVIIKNSTIKNIGPFDLSKENKVPLAPNFRTIQ